MKQAAHRLLGAAGAALALVWLAAAGSAGTADPMAMVQAFYVPYMQHGAEPPDALTTLAAHATPALRALIKKDEACEIREQGVCNIDFDPIINGQDWDLHGKAPVVTVLSQSPKTIIIAARFVTTDSATEVDYHFAQAGNGVWSIADVTSPGADDGWDLAQILAAPGG